jgi:hypothetical protein
MCDWHHDAEALCARSGYALKVLAHYGQAAQENLGWTQEILMAGSIKAR